MNTVLRWYAPFPLAPSLQKCLIGADLHPGTPGEDTIDLWIYDSPDRLLDLWLQDASSHSFEQLLDNYFSLARRPEEGRLISSWRLGHLEPTALKSWLMGRESALVALAAAAPEPLPAIPALQAQLVLRLLEEAPNLLDVYLDLELQAELVGQPADSSYLERLHGACPPKALLASCRELYATSHQIEGLTAMLAEAREEAELTLLQLHQVQEELEQVFLKSKNQEEQLLSQAESIEGITATTQLAQGERDALISEREGLTAMLAEAREEAELTLLQLHQVQEELEHYFLLSRDQTNLLNRQNQLTQNAIRLAAGAGKPSG